MSLPENCFGKPSRPRAEYIERPKTPYVPGDNSLQDYFSPQAKARREASGMIRCEGLQHVATRQHGERSVTPSFSVSVFEGPKKRPPTKNQNIIPGNTPGTEHALPIDQIARENYFKRLIEVGNRQHVIDMLGALQGQGKNLGEVSSYNLDALRTEQLQEDAAKRAEAGVSVSSGVRIDQKENVPAKIYPAEVLQGKRAQRQEKGEPTPLFASNGHE